MWLGELGYNNAKDCIEALGKDLGYFSFYMQNEGCPLHGIAMEALEHYGGGARMVVPTLMDPNINSYSLFI